MGDREDRAQHQKIEATLARHELSIEETKAVVKTEAATSSISRQIQRISLALNVDSDAEESPPPPRRVSILKSSLYSNFIQEMHVECISALTFENFCQCAPSLANALEDVKARQDEIRAVNAKRRAAQNLVEDLEDQTAPGDPDLQRAQARLESLKDQAAALGLRRDGVVAEVDAAAADRRSADALAEGSGRRLEGGEDEAQRHGAKRDGSFVERPKGTSPALAPAARRPQQVPALDWNKSFELVGGRGRGTGRESARGQTSQGRGGGSERGGHHDDANGASPRGSEPLTPMSTARSECLGTENQTSTRRQVGRVRGAIY